MSQCRLCWSGTLTQVRPQKHPAGRNQGHPSGSSFSEVRGSLDPRVESSVFEQ